MPTRSFAATDARADAVLELLAARAHVARDHLDPAMRSDELGLTPLDLALALYEIEDRYDVDLAAAADPELTLHDLVEQVRAEIDGRRRTRGAA